MINKIFVSGELVEDIVKIDGRSKGFLLKNGQIIKCREGKNFQIVCSSCDNKIGVKQLTRGHNGHLHKCYLCPSCRTTGSNNSFYGKKHSQETKDALSLARRGCWYIGKDNPMFGRTVFQIWEEKHGLEWAAKRQEEYCAHMAERVSGNKNGFYGKKHSEQTKLQLSKSGSLFWKNLNEQERQAYLLNHKAGMDRFVSENGPEYIESKRRAAHASHISQFNNSGMNNIEKCVFDHLNQKYPNKFVYSVILGKYQFDFGNKSHRILIEVHGDYWHANPSIYPEPKTSHQKKNVARDIEKRLFAERHGFCLVVIWETDILRGDFSALNVLENFITL